LIPSYRIEISPRALRDLQAIFGYLEADSPSNAAAVAERILDGIDGLKELPFRFPVKQVVGSTEIRRLVVYRYIVQYSVNETKALVRIKSIRHGSRRNQN
jgi:addiction module RelE/StbE family toxin